MLDFIHKEMSEVQRTALKSALAEAAAMAQEAIGGAFVIHEDIDITQSIIEIEMKENELSRTRDKAKTIKKGRSIQELLRLKNKNR
ncbi:hypothetical protein [Aquimarina mytili]|uniref:Uncharacterized protein n=1 Tax=Aquimarina mytili TaxID=874423 RepID=A0A937A2R9_9FLAO|nr:hypothetical protein [Aquimarina mytili]MBL0683329.1 hypothetical protein [Aquimarina mytili]